LLNRAGKEKGRRNAPNDPRPIWLTTVDNLRNFLSRQLYNQASICKVAASTLQSGIDM